MYMYIYIYCHRRDGQKFESDNENRIDLPYRCHNRARPGLL